MKKLIAVAVAAAFAAPALSQDKPKPPPAWHQGKPPAQADSKLAPHAGKMTETPAGEIPVEQAQGAGGLQGRAVGERPARRARHGGVATTARRSTSARASSAASTR